MAKQPTIVTLSSGYYSTTALTDNFDAIQAAFDNTVSRDGSTPNTMDADFDLNSNDILNAGDINATRLYLEGVRVTSLSSTPSWEGAWATSTAYVVDDLVREDGNTYICLEAHTSGTFATDLSANKWELFAQKGASGAGSGDLLAANNLSDLANADTALSNLGGGTTGIALFKDSTAAAARAELGLVIGTDVEAYDAENLKADTDDTLTAGYATTTDDDGTKSTGTYTPTYAGGNFKKITNGGAFTLAAPTAAGDYTIILKITNNASAGAITVTGFTKETGASFTTTNGDIFVCTLTKVDGTTILHVEAMQ